MTLEISDVKKVSLSDEDIRRVAQMEIKPEIRKWDADYIHHGHDLETNIRGFRGFFERVRKDEDQPSA